MNSETGTHSWIEKQQAIKNIELYTNLFKRKKISTEDFIKTMHQNLQQLTNKRNYLEYLKSIGQL